MEDIMEDNFEKLNLLLEQELCEFVDIGTTMTRSIPKKPPGDL